MTVAQVTEISAISETSFEDAINVGVNRATSALRGVEGIRIKDINVLMQHGNITGYKVNMEITFELGSDTANELEVASRRRQTRRYPKSESPVEFATSHVLLEDLTEEEIEASKRFLTITPAKRGSGFTDVSINHDRYLAED